ncbi:MAG: ABC transporter domain-containing protein [Lachnoclostridium sp.]|jgi:ABC-2 type transport system ATP-binding protein
MTDEIVISNLNQYYGKKQVLKNVNLNIGTGMFGLLGSNGAGKTTLMKVLATLLPAADGEITVCGIPITKEAQVRKITGYLPQEFSMYGNMTVYEALDYLGLLSGLSKTERQEKIPILLDKVNLLNMKKVKVKALSGGMKRRLGIAQAILHDPKVLIVDEPTAGLDAEERVRFRNLLAEIAGDRIVILSTHITADIEASCEKIALLEEGRIIFNGSVEELLDMAKGKIYCAQIGKTDLPKFKAKYQVTGMISAGNHVNLRFISDKAPFEGVSLCNPNVEDAYIYLVQNKRGEK